MTGPASAVSEARPVLQMHHARQIEQSSGNGDGGPFTVRMVDRNDFHDSVCWRSAFAGQRKDRRHYEILEDTAANGFDYRYFAIYDADSRIRAIQPFFIACQDMLQGVGPLRLVELIRLAFPRFLTFRMLMVGCSAGEAYLYASNTMPAYLTAAILADAITPLARRLRTPMILLKEFPVSERPATAPFTKAGFVRIPSMPMTRLNIGYDSFESYVATALNCATRRKLRKKLRASASAGIEVSVVTDVALHLDEIYPLYLQVYERSKLHFEKLPRNYFSRVGQDMGDIVRFFIWRHRGKAVAFSMCMMQDDSLYAEYVGFDYAVALDLHLYHYIVRDMIAWAIAHRFKWFRSSSLNYDPKLHMRHDLDPLDLYVRHTSALFNPLLKWLLPRLSPVHRDPTLKKFANYKDLW